MKILTKIILIFAFSLIANSQWLMAVSFADIPRLITYQGKLTDPQGKPVEDKAHSITFRIYDAETAGTLLWEETQSVTTQKGILSVLLGSVTALNLPFDKPYFLETKVGQEVISPRQRMASVGYAIRAEKAADVDILPKGCIILWSGSIANIPKGWALCDGTNGTPDLRDRFVVGAKQDDGGIAKTNIKGELTQSGGSTIISIDNLPPHDHGVAGEHTHSGSLFQSGGNSYMYSGSGSEGRSGMGLAGGHTHASTGKGMPYTQPYYALAYIMKL